MKCGGVTFENTQKTKNFYHAQDKMFFHLQKMGVNIEDLYADQAEFYTPSRPKRQKEKTYQKNLSKLRELQADYRRLYDQAEAYVMQKYGIDENGHKI